MNRTKYYWALVECNSVSTASWLYDQMDGLEADGAGLSSHPRAFATCHVRCYSRQIIVVGNEM